MKNRKNQLLSLLLSLVLALSLAGTASAAQPMRFSDVNVGDWYYSYVRDLYDAGVVEGMSPTQFVPQDSVTLAESLKMILLAAGAPPQEPTGDHWASGYYLLAQEWEYLPPDLPENLDEPVNRLQIAEIAVRVLSLTRLKDSPTPFADTAAEAVLALNDHGIFVGSASDEGQVFRPQANITRAEITTVIWRIRFLERRESAKEHSDSFTFMNRNVYVEDALARRVYEDDCFYADEETGFLRYESDTHTSRVGIDVSRYQGELDWSAVKAAGVDFAIIRLGLRGYGTGRIVMDEYFERNIQGALANDIEVGVYFFSQAISGSEAVEEALFALNAVKDYDITYPIVFDWEPYPSTTEARTNHLPDEVLTQCAVSFCTTVEEAGYTPMVYANLTYFYLHFDLSRLCYFPFWLAQYYERPTFYYHFDIWQYGEGQIPGVDASVDLNIQFIPKE